MNFLRDIFADWTWQDYLIGTVCIAIMFAATTGFVAALIFL